MSTLAGFKIAAILLALHCQTSILDAQTWGRWQSDDWRRMLACDSVGGALEDTVSRLWKGGESGSASKHNSNVIVTVTDFRLMPPWLRADTLVSGVLFFRAAASLLDLQGDRRKSCLALATDLRTEANLSSPEPTVELAALYVIAYLFTGDWRQALEIALIRDGARYPPGAVDSAYAAYRLWLDRTKVIGVERARSERSLPLQGTDLSWYGWRLR